MSTIFSVEGPHKVPIYTNGKARLVTPDGGRQFFAKNDQLADLRGCYVFGMRAGGGISPYYVGRATKTFRQEVFTADKLVKYTRCISDYIGTPVLFFVTVESGASAKVGQINELEDFLIQNAFAVNPDLINSKGTVALDWGIRGVLRGGKGKPSKSALMFRQLMGITGPAAKSREDDKSASTQTAVQAVTSLVAASVPKKIA